MRPYRFKLNTNHDLAQGLVFAGLGNVAGSGRYFDSSVERNPGTFEASMDPAADWGVHFSRRSLDFDGIDDYVETKSRIVDSLPATIACWVKIASVSAFQRLVHTSINVANNRLYGAYMQTTSGGELEISFGDGSAATTGARRSKTGGALTTSWHHCCGVIRGDRDADLYIDGKDVGGSYSGTGGLFSAGSGGGGIATLEYGGTLYFAEAVISDVLVWNRSLFAVEAETLADPDNYMLSGLIEKVPETKRFFFKEEPPQPTDLRLLHTPKKKYTTRPYRFKLNDNHPLSEGLVFAGLGNVAGSNTFWDSSVYRNHGTLTDVVARWVWIKNRRAFRANEDAYISLGNVPLYHGPAKWTVAAWMDHNGSTGSNFQRIASAGGTGSNFDWTLAYRPSNNTLIWGTSAGFIQLSRNLKSEPHHIIATYNGNGAFSGLKLFVDGQEQSTSNAGSFNGFVASEEPVLIGADSYDSAIGNIIDGNVGEVLFFEHDLNFDEITQLADPDNIMLSGLIEPLRDPPSYFFTQPTPTEAITGIFEPLVIGV